MMQAFRNSAKPVVYVITITFLGWMIFNLSGISGQGGFFTKTSVGSINGQPVDARVYEAAVQNAINERQQASGTSLGLEDVENVRNQVWESFIQNAVLGDEIKKYHVDATTDEVIEWIRNFPPEQLQSVPDFQTAGHFDLTKYQRWLASPIGQQYVPSLEDQARDDILRNKLFVDVTADVYLSDPALWEKYRDQHEQASISLTAIIGRNFVPDSAVPVTDAEIDAYYAAHPKEFQRPRSAFMSFVAVPRLLDASDSAAALAHANDLRKEILAGTPFADVAKRESADTTNAKAGGDLGTFARGKMVPEFDKAAFSLPLNTVSEPVRTQFGYHLIEVTKRTKDSVTARHILIPIELAGAHRALVDAEADSLQRLAAGRLIPEALDTVARALKLPIGSTGPIQEGGRVLLGTYVVPDAGVWAFQAKPGETSDVIEGEAAYYVFRLDSLHEAGTPPLAQIRGAVAAVIRDHKKDDKAKLVGEELEQRLAKGETLPDASKALHLPNRSFAPFTRVNPPISEPKVVGAAFGLPIGKPSDLLETPEGTYVIEVLQRIPADSAAFVKDEAQLRGDMIRAVKQDRVRTYIAALRADARIKDDRNAMRKTNAQAEAAQAQSGKNGN